MIERDLEGRILTGRNTTCKDMSAKNLEAKEILQAVELVVHDKWDDVIIESDAQQIINMLQGTQLQMDWELKNILMDITLMSTKIPRLHWKFAGRNTNRCANWTARMCREGMCPTN